MRTAARVTIVGSIVVLTGIIGFAAGAMWSSSRISSIFFGKVLQEHAGVASLRANTLAYLRIGKTDEAIELQENMLDAVLHYLVNNRYGPGAELNNPEALPSSALRGVQMAKLYRERFPSNNTEINQWLAKVPAPDDPNCTSGVCLMIKATSGEN